MNLSSIIVCSLQLGQDTSSTTLLNPGPQHRPGHNWKCLMDTCQLKKEARSSAGKISELYTQRGQLHSGNLEGLLCHRVHKAEGGNAEALVVRRKWQV